MQTAEVGLSGIEFPVFKLGNKAPMGKDGVSYYLYGKDVNTKDEFLNAKVIDDKNIDRPSLAGRRLQAKANGADLHKIGLAIFFIGDLVKIADAKTWFIDNTGMVFNYRKSTRAKLIFREIEQIIPIRTGGGIICVKGVPARFKTLHLPGPEMKYAGLLVVKTSYILYGLFDQQYDTTFRLI